MVQVIDFLGGGDGLSVKIRSLLVTGCWFISLSNAHVIPLTINHLIIDY